MQCQYMRRSCLDCQGPVFTAENLSRQEKTTPTAAPVVPVAVADEPVSVRGPRRRRVRKAKG